VIEDPAPILVLLPTEADCRDFLVFGCRAAVRMLAGAARKAPDADHGRAIGAQHAPAPDLSGRLAQGGRRQGAAQSAAAHRTRAHDRRD